MNQELYSLQVLIKQEGDCMNPYYIPCDTCALRSYKCYRDVQGATNYEKYTLAITMLKTYPEDIIFEMLL